MRLWLWRFRVLLLPMPRRQSLIDEQGIERMLSGLGMALRVMVASNSAFAEIRDNDHRYFPWSLGIFLFVYILFAIIDPRTPILEHQSNIVTETATSILGGVAYATVIYLVGRLLGGNKRWRQVFSVIFYTHIISIPILVVVVLAAVTFSFLPWISLPLGLVLLLLFLCWGLVVLCTKIISLRRS